MKEEISNLFNIIEALKNKYHHHGKHFTLDGKIVGDIGEVLAADIYGLELLPSNTPIYDAKEISTGRKIQIKSSFKNYCYFPFGEEKIPDYFLAINITSEGEVEELYNGSGRFLFNNYIVKRELKHYKETYYTLSKGVLNILNEIVPTEEKIQRVS